MGVGGGGEAAAAAAAPVSVSAEEAGNDKGKKGGGWRRVVLVLWLLVSAFIWTGLHYYFRHGAITRAEEGLVSMCEERARMLQDQFAVSVNHVHALAILVATFHYEKRPPALDQVRLSALSLSLSLAEPSASGLSRRSSSECLYVLCSWPSPLLRFCGVCSARAVNCVSRRLWKSLLLLPLPRNTPTM
jgi:histidine kinase 2/3/4 (cytokinin receptor)